MGEARRRRKRGLPTKTTTEVKALAAELKQQLVELADANEERMDGTTEPVLEIIADSDVVYGVWPDSSEPDGVGTLIIKGSDLVRDIAATRGSQTVRLTAIKCVELRQGPYAE